MERLLSVALLGICCLPMFTRPTDAGICCLPMLTSPTDAKCPRAVCTLSPHLPCRVASRVCEAALDKDSPEVGPVQKLDYRGYPRSVKHGKVNNEGFYLDVSWEIPVTGYMHVTGFIIKLIDDGGRLPTICYHLDMANARWTDRDNKNRLRVRFPCVEVTWEGTYWLTVLSLPNQVQHSLQMKVSNFELPDLDMMPPAWTTVVMIHALEGTNQIQVEFLPTASSGLTFNFVRYKVTLVNEQYKSLRVLIVTELNQSMPVIFNNVCKPGTWRAKVEPLKMDGGVCQELQGVACLNAGNSCEPCKVSQSSTIWFVPANPCGAVPLRPGSTMMAIHITSTIVGICAGCLLAAVLIAVLARYSPSCRGHPPEPDLSAKSSTDDLLQVNCKMPMSQRTLPSIKAKPSVPRVLILCEEDNHLHTEVIHHLAFFLKKNCKCDITYDQWDMEALCKDYVAWLMKHLEVSDTIILIHSEAGYRKYHAKKAREAYINGPSPKVGLFVPGVQMILSEKYRGNNGFFKSSENTVSVVMPYTSRKFVISNSAEFVYELMADICALIRHIHRGSKSETTMMGISDKATSERYTELPSGANLAKAISNMEHYIENNPNWFAETHAKNSKDINDDSGRGTLQERQYCEILRENSTSSNPSTAVTIVDRLSEETLRDAEDVPPNLEQTVKQTVPEVPKDKFCKATEQRQLTGSSSRVAELRQSFESNSDAPNTRSNKKLSKCSKSTSSSRETLDSVPEVVYSKPQDRNTRSSKASGGNIKSSKDSGASVSNSTPSMASKGSQASSREPLVAKDNRKKSVGSVPDYSAIVDSVFDIALCGESTGEPES